MSKYNTFLALFIISIVAFIFLMGAYFNGIMTIIFHGEDPKNPDLTAWEIVHSFLNPFFLISALAFGMSSLACRILGIVYVAQNKIVRDGEKVIWILGFIFMGFITSIVFLVMAKGKNFVD